MSLKRKDLDAKLGARILRKILKVFNIEFVKEDSSFLLHDHLKDLLESD